MNEQEESPFEVEELNPMEMIALLERDLEIAIGCLKKISRANPHRLSGGPNNKWFGRRFEQAVTRIQEDVAKALKRMETTLDE